jgi:hypothetical protein
MPVLVRFIEMAAAAAMLGFLFFPSIGAAKPPCDKPPYGADRAHYEGFMRIFGEQNPPDLLHDKLAQACEAKFLATKWSRDSWYAMGLTDADLDNTDVTDLAVKRARYLQGK